MHSLNIAATAPTGSSALPSTPLAEWGIVVCAGLVAVALGYLAIFGRNSRYLLIADTCKWLAGSRLRDFIIGTILGTYVVFVHPALTKELYYAPLIEWAILSFVVWLIYRVIRRKLERECTTDHQPMLWHKHQQIVERKVDFSFVNVVTGQEEFVELGRPDRLTTFLASLLRNGKWSEAQIREAMEPLLFHKRRKPPWYTFIFGADYRRTWYRKARREALNDILAVITGTPQRGSTDHGG